MKAQAQIPKENEQATSLVPTGLLQGKKGPAGMEEESRRKRLMLQRKSSECDWNFEIPPIVHEVLRSPGQPLDKETRNYFEPRFGHDFSQVRVHTDSKAAESARAVNALAYTVGKDVVFGAGQYTPGIAKNKWLIAHELTHIVQAVGGPVSEGPIEIARPGDTCETLAAAAARGTYLPRHVYGTTRLYRYIPMPAPRDDETARRAAQAIEVARRRLREGELSPEQHTELERRIIDAEAALAAYRRDLGRSSGVVPPMVGTTTIGNPAGALLALGAALLGWLIVSAPARDPALARELERALDRLVEPIARPVPRPEAPPQEIPAPPPPGEVIPIETHPRFQPRQQPSPPPEPQPAQRLGPDIFYVPRSEPRPRQRDRREECLETHPYALTCEDEVSMEEVVQDFIMRQGYSYESLGNCRGYESHAPGVIHECNGAPGETWHCSVSPYYDEIARRRFPGGEVSIFSCLCCRTDGTTSYEWRHPHWSPGAP